MSEQTYSPYIPPIEKTDNSLEAARKYISANLYILPVKPGTKNPGSVVGAGWPELSSTDPHQIEEWFADTDNGIALHAGRSGLIIFDVDHLDAIPQIIIDAIEQYNPPVQASRVDRAHFLFAQPLGRTLGNSCGGLARGWGEVRGANGVIIVAPTIHPDGGLYQWVATGPCPVVPESVAQFLTEATDTVPAATSVDVEQFLAKYVTNNNPHLLESVLNRYREKVLLKTFSRHDTVRDHLCWAFQEARAGFYPAKRAYNKLLQIFIESMRDDESGSGRQIDEWQTSKEFDKVARWAIGQINTASGKQIQQRIDHLEEVKQREKLHEDIKSEVHKLKVKDKAKKEYDNENWTEPLDSGRLDELLQLNIPVTPHRIDGLGKIGGNTTLAGRYKTGKTTIQQNLIRSLVDGVPFLGREVITPLTGNVAVFNYELDSDEFTMWLNELCITNTQKVHVLNLRGQRLPIMTDHGAEWTIEWLKSRDIEFWIIDPAARAITGSGAEENNSDVSKFTDQLDAIKAESTVRDLLVVTHTGRAQDNRSRGATRWDDWPDTLWCTRKEDNKRYFGAFGRKVDVDEFELVFDHDTNRLTAGEVPTHDGTIDKFVVELAHSVRLNPHKKIDYYKVRLHGSPQRKLSAEDKDEIVSRAISNGTVFARQYDSGLEVLVPHKEWTKELATDPELIENETNAKLIYLPGHEPA